MEKIISNVRLFPMGMHVVFLVVLLIGCTSTSNRQKADPKSEAVAVVNGKVITRQAFEQQMQSLAQYRSSRLFTDEQKNALLLDMVNFELILQRAVKENFQLQDESIRRMIVQEYLKQRVNGQIEPSEEELLKTYKANQVDYDKICARHILIDAKTRGEEAAKKRAEFLIHRLIIGEDFSVLASNESDDAGTKEMGGDLDCFNRKKEFVAPFLEAAFKLTQVGDFTKQPVKTSYGYHIILLTRDLRGFNANRPWIANQLKAFKNHDLFAAFMNKVKEEANVTMSFEKLKDINLTVVDSKSAKP